LLLHFEANFDGKILSSLCSTDTLLKKSRVLIKEKLNEIGAWLGHTPQKSLRRLEQVNDILKSCNQSDEAVNFNLFK
jgi:hypothetical protein